MVLDWLAHRHGIWRKSVQFFGLGYIGQELPQKLTFMFNLPNLGQKYFSFSQNNWSFSNSLYLSRKTENLFTYMSKSFSILKILPKMQRIMPFSWVKQVFFYNLNLRESSAGAFSISFGFKMIHAGKFSLATLEKNSRISSFDAS